MSFGPKTRSLSERFWEKVGKEGPTFSRELGSCWTWNGATAPGGYGKIGGGGHSGKTLRASRISWQIHFGDITESLCVLHRCDNPECTNPVHLFLGTKKENLEDMTNKGRRRSAVGERQGRAVLTEGVVRRIRERYANGEKQEDIAKDFSVGHRAISKVVTRRTWRHVV